jgi:uncharacterized phage infection (PIP) family protein YhgE
MDSLAKFFEELPELAMYTAQSAALVEQSESIKVFARGLNGQVSVFDPEAYTEAAQQIKAITAVLEGVEEIIHPYTQQAYKLHRTLTALESQYKGAGEREMQRLKSEMSAFAVEEGRRRREAEAQIAEAARQREQNRLLAEAAMAEKDGKGAEANAIFEEAMTVQAQATVIPKMVPEVSGTSQRSVWTFDETKIDMETLNREFVIPDVKRIGAVVRSMKKQAERLLGGKTVEGKWVPAVRVVESKTTVVK